MRLLSGFSRGLANANKFHSLTAGHAESSSALDRKFAENGLSKDDWNRFAFGKELSLYGVGYVFAGFLFFMYHGAISQVGTR